MQFALGKIATAVPLMDKSESSKRKDWLGMSSSQSLDNMMRQRKEKILAIQSEKRALNIEQKRRPGHKAPELQEYISNPETSEESL